MMDNTAQTMSDSMWNAIRTMVTDRTFRGYAHNLAQTAAVRAYGRVSDINVRVASNLDDILQSTALRAYERMARYSGDAGNYPITGELGSERDVYAQMGQFAVGGWYVRFAVACGVCTKCDKGRKCAAPSDRWDMMTIRRVVFSSLKSEVERAFPADVNYVDPLSGDTRADVPIDLFGRKMHAGRNGAVAADMSESDPIAPEVRRILRKVTAALEHVGLPPIAGNGLPAQDAGNMLAVAVGNAPTDNGRRAAYVKLRTMQAEYVEKIRTGEIA